MGRLRSLGLAIVLAAALPLLAFAAPKFPALTGRVVDDANLLSPATEQKLDAELAALEQKTGHQMVVATLPDLQGYEIADYGYQLGRAWGIGRKDQDDGAILIVAPTERKVRIEVGYGLEPVLTDALSSVIIQRAILPAFKDGRMEDGVVAGAEAMIAQLGLPPEEARARVAEAQAQQAAQASNDGAVDLNLPIVLIVFGMIAVITVLRWIRRPVTPYRGPSGFAWMLPLFFEALSGRGNTGGWRNSGGGGGWSSGGGGFSGGGGSFGGGGSSGSW